MKTCKKLLVAGWLLTRLAHGSANLPETAALASPLAVPLPFDGRALIEDTIGLAQTNATFDTRMHTRCLALGNGTLVAVDGHDYVLTSSDGTAWTRGDAGTVSALY